ncbi:MAG TPA: TonB-dependent receptor [Acidisarcina sp.]|nr:TonB-dependent receptor [Acidisarcina sp.]
MMQLSKFLRISLAVFLLFAAGMRSNAQINTASLTGLVTDASGAVVAKVPVTVQGQATGFTRTTETDNAGYYTFSNLPIGQYSISVSKDGFATVSQQVLLQTAEKARRDFALQVSGSQQTVTVTSAGSDLSPGDASLGTVISSETIEQTPLYLRNWDDLLRIVPGVQISRYTQQSGATSAGRTGDFNVHGVHSLQNNFLLDGIDNNTISENVQELSTEAAHPSVDVIQEFNIITNPYSAEYGRAPGAAVSVSTKGGTNQIHGLAYEYLRNRYFDANDFFSNRNHLKKPENNQNQFGGNFGGPFLHDRLFGFFNYEGTRIKQGVSRIATVPLPNERIGDFSTAAAAVAGVGAYPIIYDPTTGLPFANNQIPSSRIDPAIAGLMALFPLPNVAGTKNNNYVRNALAVDNTNSYDGRVDWTASAADNVFFRYSYSNRYRFIPGYLGGIADGTSTSAWGRQHLKSHSAVIGWTHVFSPKVVNDFHLGFVRNYSAAQQDPFGKNAANQYVPGIPNNPATAGGVPLTSFTNFAFIGSPDFLPKSQVPQQYEWVDSVSLSLGAHALRIGGTLFAPMRNTFQDEPGTRGDLGFTGIFTCQRGGANNQCQGKTNVTSGLSYADGLLGYVQSAQLTNVHFVDQRLWMASAYVQDDWKVTPKLTLNLGLRYDFATPALEGRNQMANFDPTANAGAGGLVFAKSGSMEKRALVEVNKTDFAPRIGIAYAATPTTVIRGGYGIYYSAFERFGSENQLALNPPFLINKSPSVASNATAPVFFAKNGFPSNFLDPSTINLNQLPTYHLRTMNPHDPTPNVQQWSFGLQHQFATNWTGELNYVGTKSTHLDVIHDLNQPAITNRTSSGVTPFPNFGYIEYTNSIGFGNYNGLEATLTRRYSNGLSLHAAYTYSRSLDNTPQELESNSGAPPDGSNFSSWYGPSDFDIPHRVAVSYLYELPFGKGKKMLTSGPLSYVVGGWRTSGVYTFYSGHPFTVNSGGTLASALDKNGQATATPMLIGTPHMVKNPNCWFFASQNKQCTTLAPGLTDAYALPAVGTFGNSGRNTLRGPHINVFDASLLKEFPIGERTNVEFRWEVFNVTNTPEFGQPNNNLSSGAVGQITTLSGDPRVMQFALRLSF